MSSYYTYFLLVFFIMFLAIVIWVYLPKNKSKMQEIAKIPLKDNQKDK